MADACAPPNLEAQGHASGERVQAAAIGPLWLPVLERIAPLNMSLLIENPDGFRDINQVGSWEALSDQGGTHSTPALDVLCGMVICEALPPPGCRSPAYFIAPLKYRHGMPGVTQGICGGQATASSADDGD